MSPRSRDGDRREVVLPRVGKDLARPLLVEPEELAPAQQEDAAQHERLAAIRVRLGVGQRKGAAPAPAEDDPPVDAEVLAQLLDVRHEIPGRVLPELREGCALAAAALVVQHDAPLLRIEVAVVERVRCRRPGRRAGRRAACRAGCRTPRSGSCAASRPSDTPSGTASSWERDRAGPSSSVSCRKATIANASLGCRALRAALPDLGLHLAGHQGRLRRPWPVQRRGAAVLHRRHRDDRRRVADAARGGPGNGGSGWPSRRSGC